MGTNAQIYEAQLSPIVAQMDSTHEYYFPEGFIECEAPPGVPALFQGPFYCFYAKPTAEQVKAAYEFVLEVIEEEGPFDGIMGFSQGGALAAMILLHHRKTSPHLPDLFRLAVFTCASLPFDPDTETQPQPYNTIIDMETGAVDVRNFLPGDVIEQVPMNGFLVPLEDGDVVLRRFHPSCEPTRIDIPTVHIMGKSDWFLPQQRDLADLCGPDKFIYVHDKEHALPRDLDFAQKAAALIKQAIDRALMQH
jgi:hypothetical protein